MITKKALFTHALSLFFIAAMMMLLIQADYVRPKHKLKVFRINPLQITNSSNGTYEADEYDFSDFRCCPNFFLDRTSRLCIYRPDYENKEDYRDNPEKVKAHCEETGAEYIKADDWTPQTTGRDNNKFIGGVCVRKPLRMSEFCYKDEEVAKLSDKGKAECTAIKEKIEKAAARDNP